MLHLLAFHDDVQEKLYQEIHDKMANTSGVIGYDEVVDMPYLDQVFCETLRLYPSAQRTDRQCNESTDIGGIPVHKGELINISIWAIHRDPEYWPEPEEFRPERFSAENKADIVPYSWIPFGAGPRNCIGMRLAIMEAKIGAAYILDKFRFSPGPNTMREPQLSPGAFSTPKDKKLPLNVERRA